MTLYMGVDFHPHQQTVCWCDRSTGEIKTTNLFHNLPALKEFYQTMPPSIVGIEASTNALWFEALLADTGHELRVGNPALIRAKATSRHKSDKRDAELIFDLLTKNEFPTLWRRERVQESPKGRARVSPWQTGRIRGDKQTSSGRMSGNGSRSPGQLRFSSPQSHLKRDCLFIQNLFRLAK